MQNIGQIQEELDTLIEENGFEDGVFALDIDETLSATTKYWFKVLFEKFGGAEEDAQTPEELRAKYRYTQNVPAWQNPEVEAFMDRARRNNDIAVQIEVVHGAVENVKDIHENTIPVGAYVTARYESIREGTLTWLNMMGFPPGILVMKPENGVSYDSSNDWKAGVLKQLKQVVGIADDNKGLVDALRKQGGYHGIVVVFEDVYDGPQTEFTVVSAKDWYSVRSELEAEL